MGRRRKSGKKINGWLVFDKPLEMTSTQAVGKLRWLFDAQKAGHAGTLDPLATGVLPIAFGEATKTVSYAMDDIKTYRFAVRWGQQTNTDDREGEIVETSSRRPQAVDIEAILPEFLGEIEQTPPSFSAVHVKGERAYDLARQGENVKLAARRVIIHEFELIEMVDSDTSLFEVTCGKGTYVRALARDMGLLLGCFGHVHALRRLQVGCFGIEEAISLEKLEELRHSAPGTGLLECLAPVETPLDDIPAVHVNPSDADRLYNGQAVLLRGQNAPVTMGTAYAMSGNRLVAIGEISKGRLMPKRVFRLG